MEELEQTLFEETEEISLSEAAISLAPRLVISIFAGFFAMKSVQQWAYRGF